VTLPSVSDSTLDDPRVVDAPTLAPVPPAVVVDDLHVRFKTRAERAPTLKHTLANLRGRKHNQTVDALRGVSFEVPTGSVYGVIGRNGAGKSTLFRVIAGILAPTGGMVTVRGRVTPLLSLGVGFNRELTGRDNILLGGLAAGLSRDQVDAARQDILDFAELGEAIDYPMRTYSSGMFGRLAFSVAAHLEPEILLVDEALSAGDAKFKAKCMAKIVELCERDCTVMIVTHGLGIVKHLATECLWIDKGLVYMEGAADEVVGAYLELEGMALTDLDGTGRRSLKDEAALEDF
jgi:teichoic acid transport system ATP-binding protein